jgi:hypothetical protein
LTKARQLDNMVGNASMKTTSRRLNRTKPPAGLFATVWGWCATPTPTTNAWDERFTGRAVVNWIRAGFSLPPVKPLSPTRKKFL